MSNIEHNIEITFNGIKLDRPVILIKLLAIDSEFKREFGYLDLSESALRTLSRAMVTTANITYKDGWSFRIGRTGDMIFVQVQVNKHVGVCSLTGKSTAWRGGKRYLSKHMTQQELTGVMFDLIRAAEEHEMREFFRYKGASIYNPHLNPDALVEVAKVKENFNCRPNNESMDMK